MSLETWAGMEENSAKARRLWFWLGEWAATQDKQGKNAMGISFKPKGKLVRAFAPLWRSCELKISTVEPSEATYRKKPQARIWPPLNWTSPDLTQLNS